MIKVSKRWFVDVDEHNYILKQLCKGKKVKKDGSKCDDVIRIVGYFSTLEAALKRMGDEMIREKLIDTDITLAEACRIMKDTKKEWQKIVDEVKSI